MLAGTLRESADECIVGGITLRGRNAFERHQGAIGVACLGLQSRGGGGETCGIERSAREQCLQGQITPSALRL